MKRSRHDLVAVRPDAVGVKGRDPSEDLSARRTLRSRAAPLRRLSEVLYGRRTAWIAGGGLGHGFPSFGAPWDDGRASRALTLPGRPAEAGANARRATSEPVAAAN